MKKTIALLLVIITISSLLCVNSFSIEVSNTNTFTSIDNLLYDNNPLKEEFKTASGLSEKDYIDFIYMFFNTMVVSKKTEVNVSEYKLPYTTGMIDAIKHLIAQIPELYYLKAQFSFSRSSTILYRLVFNFEYSINEINEMDKEIESVSEKLLDGIINNDSLSDELKALLIHDRLVVWNEYDEKVLTDISSDRPADYTIYGSLVERNSVCAGYANAYSYLLSKLGIKSYYNASDKLYHAWNIVYINDIPYHVDTTFDDPTKDIIGRVSHSNLLVSSNTLYSNKHNADDYVTTPVSTDFEKMFWTNTSSQVLLVNNDIYYFDQNSAKLMRLTAKDAYSTIDYTVSEAVFTSNDTTWSAGSNSYWNGNYTKITSNNDIIFISTPKKVYYYNTITKDSGLLYTLPLTEIEISIYGFTCEDEILKVVYNNSPNFTSTTQSTNIIYIDLNSIHTHNYDSYVTIKEPTYTEKGLIRYECIECGQYKYEESDVLVPEVIKGDLNGDSRVNAADANLIKAIVLGKPCSDLAKVAADINNDEKINSIDCNLMSKIIVGIN